MIADRSSTQYELQIPPRVEDGSNRYHFHRRLRRCTEAGYLLGFDVEKLEPRPLKTYIRRLWLALESGKGLTPKRFFDPQAAEFAKEIDHWVSVLVNDPSRLAAELEVDPEYGIDGVPSGSRFLVDIVHTMLVIRKWGEALWGCKKASQEEHKRAIETEATEELTKIVIAQASAIEQPRKRKLGEDRHLEVLANSKPEEGDNEHPIWPQDEKR